jgi:syringate O-demethylase
MTFKNLDERMKAAGGAMKLLRDSQTGPNPYPVVKPEYSNWRDEQWAWQNAAVIFNQSYHMTDLYVTGSDAFARLECLGINSFAGFVPGKAKQTRR